MEDSSRLKIFGSLAYALIPQEKQKMDKKGKLQQQATRCFLVGVGEDSRSFRLYDPKLCHSFESYHIKIFEREFGREHTPSEDNAVAKWMKGDFLEDESITPGGDSDSLGAQRENLNKPEEKEKMVAVEEEAVVIEEAHNEVREAHKHVDNTPRPLGRNSPRSNRGVPPLMAPGMVVPPSDSRIKITLTPIVIQPPPIVQPTSEEGKNTPVAYLALSRFDCELENIELAEIFKAWTRNPDEPSFKGVLRTTGPDQAAWDAAIEAKLAMLCARETWDDELVSVPSRQKLVALQWVFLVKHDREGVIVKHKARLVVRGDLQLESANMGETFAPTIKITSLRAMSALLAQSHQPGGTHFKSCQFDVALAYLILVLNKLVEIYVGQVPGRDNNMGFTH